jgi:hypothetical protein
LSTRSTNAVDLKTIQLSRLLRTGFNLLSLSPFSGSLSQHWKGRQLKSQAQISQSFSGYAKSSVSKNLQRSFRSFFQSSKDSQGRQLGSPSPLAGVRNALSSESFQFIANGAVIESFVKEAFALFPAVREQLSVDGCGRKFILKDSGIEAADIRSLQLLLSGESISIGGSQFLLSDFLEM